MSLQRFALVLVALLCLLGCSGGSSDGTDFADLTVDQRVYDETGDALSSADAVALQGRLDALDEETGADVIVYVRELDADPDETLDQVEALQQAWVAATGTDQDTAGAILINREPGTDDEARAGLFVGTTYDDGNVPRDEQEAIVADELVPPLRDDDVAGSLGAGIDRLESSIRTGPPTNAVDDLADGPGSTWLPWAGLALALLGLAGVALVFRGRATPSVAEQSPTTARPDHALTPSLAGALVAGRAQASAVPAVILDLAARDALVVESEKAPRKLSDGTVAIRLLDRGLVRGDVEQAVWGDLAERAEDDLVDSSSLTKVAGSSSAVRAVVTSQLRERGWLGEHTVRPRVGLVAFAVLGALLLAGGLAVIASGAVLMLVTVIPAGLLVAAGVVAATAYSPLSVAGRDAARPWEAYRDGLKAAGKDEDAPLDLDAVLPDVIALNLGTHLKKRLEAATEDGTTLRAFTAPAGTYVATNPAIFGWGAFVGVFGSSGGSSAGASGGGAGGGGGAAGGT